MKLVREHISFERNQDPKKIMGVGVIEQIHAWMKEYARPMFDENEKEIKYQINKDGTIDLKTGITLNQSGFSELPEYIQFNICHGDFLINWNNLKNLKGCPRVIYKSFYINGNPLTSLEGMPEVVGGVIHISLSCGFTKEDIRKVCKCNDIWFSDGKQESADALKIPRERYLD